MRRTFLKENNKKRIIEKENNRKREYEKREYEMKIDQIGFAFTMEVLFLVVLERFQNGVIERD